MKVTDPGLNQGPLTSKARIIALDQQAMLKECINIKVV